MVYKVYPFIRILNRYLLIDVPVITTSEICQIWSSPTMVSLNQLVENTELSEDLFRNTKIDKIRISYGCPTHCAHCSESPDKNRLDNIGVEELTSDFWKLKTIADTIGVDIFAHELLTSPDTDPSWHPQYATIFGEATKIIGKAFYLLTSGWNLNNKTAQNNAEEITRHPKLVNGVRLSVHTFHGNNYFSQHRVMMYANALRTFKDLIQYEKFSVFLQYTDETSEHSLQTTESMLNEAIYLSGIPYSEIENLIRRLPIISKGRATTQLGVKFSETRRILSDVQEQDNAIYSGLVQRGELLVCPTMNGTLGVLNGEIHSGGYKDPLIIIPELNKYRKEPPVIAC